MGFKKSTMAENFGVSERGYLVILAASCLSNELIKRCKFSLTFSKSEVLSPSFLRADSQRDAAELTITRSKRGRVV